MRGLNFLYLLAFLCSVLSCELNPLKSIPEELQDGSLRTGLHHISFFENALYEKLVKVSILDRSDLMMEFTEGKGSSYTIQIRLLYNLGSKYKVQLKEQAFSVLEGAKWKFDSEENKGILLWRPSKIFTEEQSYKQFSLPLTLEFSEHDSDSDTPAFIVERAVNVIVHKSSDEPEIYKISTYYADYEKLNDGYFYTKYGANFLDFSYYDRIFVGFKRPKEIFSHLMFYSEKIYGEFNVQKYPKLNWGIPLPKGHETDFDSFKIHNGMNKGSIPFPLIRYIKQPLYYPSKIRETEGDCDSDMVVLNDKNENWCLEKLNIEEPFSFDKDVYVKYYEPPQAVDLNHLFYRIDSRRLCEVYHHISLDYIFRKIQKWGRSDFCYLSFGKVHSSPSSLGDNEDIYILRESGEIEFVDKEREWKFSFYKIPESTKWQLGGYKPISDNILPINLIRNSGNAHRVNKIIFYVKDLMSFDTAPVVVPNQRINQILFWSAPIDMNIKWTLGAVNKIDSHLWQLNYNIDLKTEEDESKNYFRQFQVSFAPVSQLISGEPISLQFNILPYAKAEYTEYFNPETDLEISKRVTGTGGWSSGTFSLSHQVQARYIFPSDFLSDIRRIISFKDIPFYEEVKSEEEKISDYVDIRDITLIAPYSCGQNNQLLYFIGESSCECSKWEESRRDDQVYIESMCSYHTEFHLDSEDMKNSDGELISAYWLYDYSFSLRSEDREIALNNEFYERNHKLDIPISLRRQEFSPSHQPASKISGVQNKFHIFFNLQPQLICSSESGSEVKKCKIIYQLNSSPLSDIGLKLNEDENFFSERGVQMNLSCTDRPSSDSSSLAENCPCEKPVFSAQGMEIHCEFQREQKASLSVQLFTGSPYIYFINVDEDNSLENYKRTPVVDLELP